LRGISCVEKVESLSLMSNTIKMARIRAIEKKNVLRNFLMI
jgi:hypothetical protein